MHRFLAVVHARNMEYLRDRATLSWNIVFPLLLIIGFSVVFDRDDADLFKVAVVGSIHDAQEEGTAFAQLEHVNWIEVTDIATTVRKVERHEVDMLIELVNPIRYWVNETSPKGYMLEQLLVSSAPGDLIKQPVSGAQVRYGDWVLPGILAMNIMFSCLYGVGYVIVRYRKNGVLKRLSATPLTAFQFLSAQVASRLMLMTAVTAMLLLICDWMLDVYMVGSWLVLLLVFVLGSLAMISMGLLTAARIKTEEVADGILNVIVWPMMMLSGVWFSLDGMSPVVRGIANVLPLTHITGAARAVMLDGATVVDIAPELLFLAIVSVFFTLLGASIFRWQ